ncbi:MAG: hypothetical protein IKL53_08285 [Lachnospiraceae bacterium]|nr:hypothetical protein [Lachnospiraceae bacterium]
MMRFGETEFKVRKPLLVAMVIVLMSMLLGACDVEPSDSDKTLAIGQKLSDGQATPTDIEYSLERYNLIRRAYWVNGEREKAANVPCPVEKPLGYIYLFEYGIAFGPYVVDGKVSSLNSYLTPDSEYYSTGSTYNKWLPDVDGSYGMNDSGIFFFTPDGNYHEWTGKYHYSDVPFEEDVIILK